MPSPRKLGFAVLVLGREGLKSADTRRWQNSPHLRVSLGYLEKIFDYLEEAGITMYRMSSDLAPYCTHPDMPQFHGQIRECEKELAALGERARAQGLRLSLHPSQYIIINGPAPELTRKSILDLEMQAATLDGMGLGPEAVVVLHVGGVYGDRPAARDRWAAAYETLSPAVRRRLVLENDDTSFSAADVLAIHEKTGVPLIFDHQHHCCLNPEGLPAAEAFRRFLRTWPAGVRPKHHFSSPRTQMREVERRDRKTKKLKTVLLPPLWSGHADYVDPFVFIAWMRELHDVEFDVMLEAKVKDLALRRLRADLARYAPDVAAQFGIAATGPADEPAEVEVPAETLAAA